MQLYDDQGQASGTAPRSRMRAENLCHAATSVVVRDSYGRVYVHRRTDTKDVYPGRYDFTAGGVLGAGEDPDDAAGRELAEELGITSAALTSLGVRRYTDDHTDYWAHCYTTAWDGPIRWQPEEVAWGDWWTPDLLVERLDDPVWPMMPDAIGVLGDWLRERAADRAPFGSGRDCVVTLVEGRWVERTARHPDAEARLRREAAVLPRLAAQLPVPVPVAQVWAEEPLRVRHRLIPGTPADHCALTADDGHTVGALLRALHDLGPPADLDLGVDMAALLNRCRRAVLPLLSPTVRDAGEALLQRLAGHPGGHLTHGDMGPVHLLRAEPEGPITGVIDWADIGLRDPAYDLAWLLHGAAPEPFRTAVATAYDVTEDDRARAADWFALGPWHVVLHGLDHRDASMTTTGLQRAEERLGSADRHPPGHA